MTKKIVNANELKHGYKVAYGPFEKFERTTLWLIRNLDYDITEVLDFLNNRAGNYYVLSYNIMLDKEDEFALVHGRIEDEELGAIGYAWLETEEHVIDPVYNRCFDKEVYYNLLKTTPNEKFGFKRMLETALKLKVYGPWDNSTLPRKKKKKTKQDKMLVLADEHGKIIYPF